MPEPTFEQKKAVFDYWADPVFSTIIETMVKLSVDEQDPHRVWKWNAALDFFLYGVTMVAHPSLFDRPNLYPFDFAIDTEGCARYTGKPPEKLVKAGLDPLDLRLTPDQYVLLQVEGNLDPPRFVDGKVEGTEPWVAAWRKAEGRLDAFLGVGRVPMGSPE